MRMQNTAKGSKRREGAKERQAVTDWRCVRVLGAGAECGTESMDQEGPTPHVKRV